MYAIAILDGEILFLDLFLMTQCRFKFFLQFLVYVCSNFEVLLDSYYSKPELTQIQGKWSQLN
jgi:hypothetical protein